MDSSFRWNDGPVAGSHSGCVGRMRKFLRLVIVLRFAIEHGPGFSRTGEGSQAREPLSHRERGWGEGRRSESVEASGAPRIGISVLPLRVPSSAFRAPYRLRGRLFSRGEKG